MALGKLTGNKQMTKVGRRDSAADGGGAREQSKHILHAIKQHVKWR